MTDPPLPELIALYLAACRVEGKSPRTLQAYGWTLDRFQRALAEDGAPDDVRQLQALHVIPYLDRSAHLARETRHRYFREVRCFFAWCQRTRVITDSPFQGLRNVSLPRRIVQPYRPEEVAVSIEIDARLPGGASEQVVRTVTEHGRTLKFEPGSGGERDCRVTPEGQPPKRGRTPGRDDSPTSGDARNTTDRCEGWPHPTSPPRWPLPSPPRGTPDRPAGRA